MKKPMKKGAKTGPKMTAGAGGGLGRIQKSAAVKKTKKSKKGY